MAAAAATEPGYRPFAESAPAPLVDITFGPPTLGNFRLVTKIGKAPSPPILYHLPADKRVIWAHQDEAGD